MSKTSGKQIERRTFLHTSCALGAGLTAGALSTAAGGAAGANERFTVAVMGLSRGLGIIRTLFDVPNVDIAYVCDVDLERIDRAVQTVDKRIGKRPAGVQDFRRLLDDPAIDAVFIATCNHWHAPATILACKAGKHVYVEKPGSQNPHEGELMVAAAKKYGRTVQMGNQRRSWPSIIEAIARLHGGAIGVPRFARCSHNGARKSIGRGHSVPIPKHLDYSIWQGPAPERPYKSNLVHYNWHWHWHWGNGELGNNGVHSLDIARWGLRVHYPLRASYVGGRYHFDDDQETPDSGVASFDFGDVGITWDGSSCQARRGDRPAFVEFSGDDGTLAIRDPGYVIYDNDGKEVVSNAGKRDDPPHMIDFFDCIKSGRKPHSHIEDAQRSTLLCHLGNIAYRTGETIHFDPAARQIVGSDKGAALWKREYRPGWEPTLT